MVIHKLVMAWFMLTCQPSGGSDGHVCKGEFDLGEKPALTIPQTALFATRWKLPCIYCEEQQPCDAAKSDCWAAFG